MVSVNIANIKQKSKNTLFCIDAKIMTATKFSLAGNGTKITLQSIEYYITLYYNWICKPQMNIYQDV